MDSDNDSVVATATSDDR